MLNLEAKFYTGGLGFRGFGVLVSRDNWRIFLTRIIYTDCKDF